MNKDLQAQLEEAAHEHCTTKSYLMDSDIPENNAFKAGAQWMHERMVERIVGGDKFYLVPEDYSPMRINELKALVEALKDGKTYRELELEEKLAERENLITRQMDAISILDRKLGVAVEVLLDIHVTYPYDQLAKEALDEINGVGKKKE